MENNKQISSDELKNKCESLFKKMLNAFALHEIVVDDSGKPVDYRFIEVNESFEKMVGLKKEDIAGKLVTEVIPDIKKDKANWVERYGKVALGGGEEHFEEFSAGLNKWFHIYVYSPEHGFFATIFDDITDRKNMEIALKEKIEQLEKINSLMTGREITMVELKQKISELEKKLAEKK